MSSVGRGRGYTGRHHVRERRPGDEQEPDASRTLTELSPRATDSSRPVEPAEKRDMDSEKEEVKPEKHLDDDSVIKELLHIDEQYVPLLSLLEQFSPGEDGIQFNRKLRHFETTVTNMCTDETRLQQAFATFRAAGLLSAVTARKLAAVGASFTRQQRQQVLRATLLNVVMQGTYSKLDVLERSNPLFLINAANLMGDYFAEARLCNGNKVHILASPMLQYMRALLASDDIRAHRSLATQLMQNGREILSVLAQELDELSMTIRLRLLSPPPVSTIWLLLSADLCLNKFLPLPNILQQFYAAHLELTTEESYSEVTYGSWKRTPEKDEFKDNSQEVNEKVSQIVSQLSLNNNDDSKPRLRPILGAGAGLLRQEQAFSVAQDTYDTWTPKSLSKRYDLNSWRQAEEEKKEEIEFNHTVLPPAVQPFPVPDYPPPRINYQENFHNYLQQGDGVYVQNQYTNVNFNQQGDGFQYPERAQVPVERTLTERINPEITAAAERINNELQKNSNRRPVENWRKEKVDVKDDPNKNKQRNWTRQKSKDSINDEDEREKEKFKDRASLSRYSFADYVRDSNSSKMNRRNSEQEGSVESGKTPPRRHVSDVPRNHKYWDHDDRCDKDYNS